MRFNCRVTNGVVTVASSITNQKRFGTCLSVYPKRVISATCSGLRYVGVITYNGGMEGILVDYDNRLLVNRKFLNLYVIKYVPLLILYR